MKWSERRTWLALGIAGVLTLTPAVASLPSEVATTRAARMELLRDGKVAGSIELPTGAVLSLVDVNGSRAIVRYRNLNGRVNVADTNLPPPVDETPSVAPASIEKSTTRPAGPGPSSPKNATPSAQPYSPSTAMERLLAKKLVSLENGALRPFASERLAGVKFYALYFSAGWCPPCREFTPGFVDAYAKIRALYPEFEVVLVNRDRSPAEMFNYMRDDHMTWPALRWDQTTSSRELNRYSGDGIPCLVLVDASGSVLSDSYRHGGYVGPDAVLDDTWKILRDFRRANPRGKS